MHCGAIIFLLTRASGPWQRQASPFRWAVGGGPRGLSFKVVALYYLPRGVAGQHLGACEETQENHGKRRPLEHPVQGSHRVTPMDREVWVRQ